MAHKLRLFLDEGSLKYRISDEVVTVPSGGEVDSESIATAVGDYLVANPVSTANPMIILTKSSSANQNVGGANNTEVWWTWDGETTKDSIFTHSNDTDSEQITVGETGWYHIRFCGNAQQTGGARTTLEGIIKINSGSTLRTGTIKSYSRGQNYGNLSPGIDCIMSLTADDIITVGTNVEDSDSTYTINTNGAEIADEENQLMIIKIA